MSGAPGQNESLLVQRRREAAQWALELRQGDVGAERVAAWTEWSQTDADNLEAFAQADALASGLSTLAPETKRALLEKFAPESSKRRRMGWPLALAASVLLACGALLVWNGAQPAQFTATYVTSKAENRSFKLPDGTRLDLGASTRVDIAYSGRERVLDLRDGEAYFDVAVDTRRPLIVRTGELHITDIGTRFDVRNSGGHITVTVSEGIVDVRKLADAQAPATVAAASRPAAVRLLAGEQIRADRSTANLSEARVDKVDLRTAMSWRTGRLNFHDEPLALVIANVNRYAPREIVIVDPQVARMRFTGTVFQNRTDDWLTATSHLFALRVEESADGRVLLYAQNSLPSR